MLEYLWSLLSVIGGVIIYGLIEKHLKKRRYAKMTDDLAFQTFGYLPESCGIKLDKVEYGDEGFHIYTTRVIDERRRITGEAIGLASPDEVRAFVRGMQAAVMLKDAAWPEELP